ncbi:MAG TPA: hypothetical protein VGE86_03735 [Thermoanaerobaculia bacterium]
MSVQVSLRVAFAAALLMAACSTSQSSVSTTPTDASVDKSFRVLGRDNDVRIEAKVLTNEFRQAANVAITYEIENFRKEAIAFAPLAPTVDYEPGSRTLTVGLGSEIPVEEAFPRLVRILPGERRTFSTGARLTVPPPATSSRFGPRYLQLRFNYLDGTEPFEPMIANGGHATGDQEGLFRNWLDHIAAVVTNALPIRWGAGGDGSMASAAERSPVALP